MRADAKKDYLFGLPIFRSESLHHFIIVYTYMNPKSQYFLNKTFYQ